ncbi:hypothetical protein FK535_02890 [Mycolicibacterium sp. 018/SC-01/001]|uniref:LpqN/LpqT family lipoprotein n=1 Tax=Mycolicibacterium sp. 018/SC-01/001 TaxID=2592069 RepID=UPI00117E04D7|nr:LpqN/LpqT family lipoprotein [Mycolicibacterium sp. 018/SC-01/001]TRW89210.1 hypothetical protein FK535_02890 [Mycolicibacterium sp. 018/SC-01/001]
MSEIARGWRVLAEGLGAGAVATVTVLALAAPVSAQPLPVQPTLPSPVGIAQPAAAAVPAAMAPATPGVAVPAGVVAAPQPQITPATSGTLRDFFAAKGVTMQPQSSSDFRALNIVLPMPRGWQHIPDPNVPDAFAVIADRVGGNGLYSSNAQIVVYKLVGDFDPREAISHGFIDAQQQPAWRATDASFADFGGMPSSLIEGTYRENAMTLNTSRRHVIATVGPDRYLVSLAVTTSVDQVVAAADATDAIVKGFKVSVPSAAPVPGVPLGAPPAPAPPAPPAPALPAAVAPAPQLLGLQG